MKDFLFELAKNDVFSGLGAASVVAWVLYVLRTLPYKLWEFLKWRYTCTLTVFNEDSSFEKVNEWLAQLDYTKRCRRKRLVTQWHADEQEDVEVLAPGLGNHFFWYRGRPMLVKRSLPEKGGLGSWKRFEDIDIVTLGRNPEVMQHLVKEIAESRKKLHRNTTSVFLYRHRWRLNCRKPKRRIDTVVIKPEQKELLLGDLARFLDARKWYQERGVPYRRSYMLEGAPGCGKTSLVLAVAAHFERPVYTLNLGSLGNDDELIDAVSEVPEHAVLLIEDIDAAQASAKRAEAPAQVTNGPTNATPKEEKREVSLSALLNVLDGAFSREGRILFMTTNHPDKLDPALLRPGRADLRLELGELGSAEVSAMVERFIEDPCEAGRFAAEVPLPVAPAELQERLVRHVRSRKAA